MQLMTLRSAIAALGISAAAQVATAQSTCPPLSKIGAGCPYGIGGLPDLSLLGDLSSQPDNLALIASNVQGLGFLHLVLGQSSTPIDFGGCLLWVTPDSVSGPIYPDPSGLVTVSIPPDVWLSPTDIFAQVVVPDTSTSSGIASSDAYQLDFGSPCIGIDVLLFHFSSPNQDEADAARVLLIDRGFDAVAGLIATAETASPTTPYGGTPLFHHTSSTPPISIGGVRVDSVAASCLYTVDAILTDRKLPYRYPFFRGSAPAGLTRTEHAVHLYSQWFFTHGGAGSIDDLIAAPHPFEGSSLDWSSPLLLADPASYPPPLLTSEGGDGPVWEEVPDSETPGTSKPVDPPNGGPGETQFSNPDGSNSGSYNCLGSALQGGFDGVADRWIHPWGAGQQVNGNPPQGFPEDVCMDGIMAGNGYSTEPPPTGGYREVKVYRYSNAPEFIKDGFVHATGRDVPLGPLPPTDWKSKNGYGKLFCIKDGWIDIHLIVFGYGFADIVECYYKPL